MTAPLWTAAELVRATRGTMRESFDAAGVSIDTRSLAPGEMFVALVGENGDGHAFVAQALARGAAGAMVHRTEEVEQGSEDGARLLAVGDTLQGLRDLAAAGRTRFAGRLAAVTGSVGKTTTKEMLRTILAAQGATHAAAASHNNHWGVPLTLARLPAAARFCVAEIGMNHPGEIAPLARLARPHVAVVTTVGSAHIGHMGSLEAIADEKAAILDGLEPDGIAVLPADAPLLSRLRARAGSARTVLFGAAESADARLVAAEGDADGTDVVAALHGRRIAFRLRAPGRHMAMNALAALAAAEALGADPDRAAAALAEFVPVAGRGAQRPIRGGRAVLLDESYNASAPAVRAALDVLRLIPAVRRVAVLGDMLELGEHGAKEHAELAENVASCADILYACGALSRHLFDAIPPAMRGGFATDSAALAPLVARAVRDGDAVLVKGSLGSRMKLVVQALEDAR